MPYNFDSPENEVKEIEGVEIHFIGLYPKKKVIIHKYKLIYTDGTVSEEREISWIVERDPDGVPLYHSYEAICQRNAQLYTDSKQGHYVELVNRLGLPAGSVS